MSKVCIFNGPEKQQKKYLGLKAKLSRDARVLETFNTRLSTPINFMQHIRSVLPLF